MKPRNYFSIWRYLGYGLTPVTPIGKLNALKKDRKSLKKKTALRTWWKSCSGKANPNRLNPLILHSAFLLLFNWAHGTSQ